MPWHFYALLVILSACGGLDHFSGLSGLGVWEFFNLER
jgi:hypothetical protein